jgi:hypothetical protein
MSIPLSRALVAGLFGLTLGSVACAGPDDRGEASDTQDVKAKKVKATAEERASYLAKAGVWLDPSLEAIRKKTPDEILAGPPGDGAIGFNADLTCDFVEPDKDNQLGGATPKFECKLASGDVVKVKYSRNPDQNREVFSEIIATRLLWTLGLAADRVYPVHVTCNNCPEEPWAAHVQLYGGTMLKRHFKEPGARGVRRFELAAVEQKFEGAKIEGPDGSAGWSFEEIPRHPKSYWEGSRAERDAFDDAHPELEQLDALRLLSAWAKHADNKSDNQRLVCAPGGASSDGGRCEKPLAMVHDMGVSFGGGAELLGLRFEAKAQLESWKNQAKSPTWKDFSECQASLQDSPFNGTLEDPHVSNRAQRFLAARLNALSIEQIRAIFTAARMELSGEEVTDPATGRARPVNIEDWVRGFVFMRDIVTKPCPEPK